MAIADEKENKPLSKGGENDCSAGPVKQRGCTDIFCCIFFLAHWFVFVVLMIWAFTAGNPGRLVAQRDYKGAFCGYKDNFEPWNEVKNGIRYDMSDHKKIINTMNVHSAMENVPTVRSLMCQIYAVYEGTGGSEYQNACLGGAAVAGAANAMSNMMDPNKAVASLTSGSPSPMEQISKFFHNVCVSDCDEVSNLAIDSNFMSNPPRYYHYHPPPNSDLYPIAQYVWNKYSENSLAAQGLSIFRMPALPTSICPEDPMYCVPYPGLEYSDVANYCIFKIGAAAAAAAGEAASAAAGAALDNGAAQAVTGDLATSFGDIVTAWPSFIIMFFISLCCGFAFMILLRFAVGIMVWSAIGIVFVILGGAGGYFFAQTICKTETVATTNTVTVTSAGNSSSLLRNLESIEDNNLNYDNFRMLSGNVTNNNSTTTTTSAPNLGTATVAVSSDFEDCVEKDPDTRDQYKIFSYVFFALAGLYALIILCMCSRIMLGIAINKVAATYMYQTKEILLLPVGQIFVSFIWWLIWLIAALFVLSSVDSEGNAFVKVPDAGPYTKDEAEGTFFTPGKCNANYPPGGSFFDEYAGYRYTGAAGTSKRELVPDTECKYVLGQDNEKEAKCYRCTLPRMEIVTIQFAYIFFSLLWNNAFIIAVGQCTIAGSVAIWYFTPNAEKGSKASVRPALSNCFRFHGGSLAFGAFILAVVQFIKWVLRYIQKQAEQQKNYLLAKIAMALQCLVHCFERFIKFLNKNAYIQIAILGKNFCRSAWAAFCLILRNMARIGVLATIGSMVNAIGLVFISAATTIIGYFIVVAMYEEEITSPIMCTFLMFMMGYMIGKLFMCVFALAVDTTLQCFCADEELNNGANDYTPEELKGFLKDPTKKRGCCG